ncbi:hypothetical protein FHETE_7788 [Fusarium heterosporum]|uniref:Uncharacterized protein n=1 Tax=Fusarium heterosporum TaxID=42747 RepID=A0A8H5T3T6_FUSHE|nr:hypothetical protein FHETE_7788 [Fusarium heterosporum]
MSVPSRFLIFVDGRPLPMPSPGSLEDGYRCIAEIEGGDPPAIFELRQEEYGPGQLVSGPFALGRHRVEDLSLRPKPIIWVKAEDIHSLQPLEVRDRGNGNEIIFQGRQGIILQEGKLFSPLLDDHPPAKVELRAA